MTLVSEYGNEIKDISYPDLPDNVYEQKLKHLHTKSVKMIITNNKILNTVPPEINNSEKTLPRKTRSTLAQLRSGYSKYLNSYTELTLKLRINVLTARVLTPPYTFLNVRTIQQL